MSKRRQPGEIVRRTPGSGFLADAEPQFVRVPDGAKFLDYDGLDSEGEGERCTMGCGDKHCREWANVEVVGGPHAGKHLYHIAECQMSDASAEEIAAATRGR